MTDCSFNEIKSFFMRLGSHSNAINGFDCCILESGEALKTPIVSKWANHCFLWGNDSDTELISFMGNLPHLIRIWTEGDFELNAYSASSLKMISRLECMEVSLPTVQVGVRNPFLHYKIVNNMEDLQRWHNVCMTGFRWDHSGIFLFSQAIYSDSSNDLLLCYRGDDLVGQSLIHYGDQVTGSHYASVLPGFRNQGIAKDMARERIQLAKRKGYKKHVVQCAPSSVKIYQRLGYKTTEILSSYES